MQEERIGLDLLSTLAKGTDAGIYRLIPERVVVVNNDEELRQVLAGCRKNGKQLTFKAGGTSLSGQTITDSVLVELGPGYGQWSIAENGFSATFACGITGEHANRLLRPYGRKLGPSPASIKSARIGGIVANNSSGSSYGILYNSYHTVSGMRIILADGTELDTASMESRQAFVRTHDVLLGKLSAIREDISRNPEISAKIRYKYELKNTCGYGMNAFLDYEDPLDILPRLMIGSEGTLGFISEATFHTVPDFPLKATALIYFPDLSEACKAIAPLRQCKVYAAELMDRNALHAVEEESGMPEVLRSLPEEAVALLLDTSSDSEDVLKRQFQEIERSLEGVRTLFPVSFTIDPGLYATYWRVRNGLFTSAAGKRPRGTASIIEDIAFREEVLGEALTEVRKTLSSFGFGNAVMWGHLLDGNVHFTIFPDINKQEGVDVYAACMTELVRVVLVYEGSLKAEHGTGRNMAPFVRQEWGDDIYDLMKRVKEAFDPDGLLNPGVILNDDPAIFVKNLKRIPLANELIDRCVECGFCEVQCPSRLLTLTPRQRIVIYRELSVLSVAGATSSRRYRALKEAFRYQGERTCATDGLCASACPIGINTGLLVKELRWKEQGVLAGKMASFVAGHIGAIAGMLRLLLSVPHGLSKVVGYKIPERFAAFLYRITGHHLPLWVRYIPKGAHTLPKLEGKADSDALEMVYFPSCITRSMGPSADYQRGEAVDVTRKTVELLVKAGCSIRYPERVNALCCGMAFSSKGFRQQAATKEAELNEALLRASDNGRLPVLCDMSPCLSHMRETLDKRLRLYEPVEFITDYLLDRLKFKKLPVTVAVHSTCSTTKMGLAERLGLLASMCAERVVTPAQVTCCGWAGDRGFFYPELNASALRYLRPDLDGATEGYSNSRTCEIGLTMNSGISYKSIVYLVDKATVARKQKPPVSYN